MSVHPGMPVVPEDPAEPRAAKPEGDKSDCGAVHSDFGSKCSLSGGYGVWLPAGHVELDGAQVMELH